MVPFLLAAPEVSDPTAMIIAGLSACVAFMAGILSTVLLAKLGSLTKKTDGHDTEIKSLLIMAEGFRGFTTTAAAKIQALEANTLTREYFTLATDAQNHKLDANLVAVEELKAEVKEIDRAKASRSDLRAVSRIPERPPMRRTDGPGSDPPSMPPPPPLPPRPKLPSRR